MWREKKKRGGGKEKGRLSPRMARKKREGCDFHEKGNTCCRRPLPLRNNTTGALWEHPNGRNIPPIGEKGVLLADFGGGRRLLIWKTEQHAGSNQEREGKKKGLGAHH